MPATPRLLLTRPAAQSARFARQAQAALGPLTVTIAPLLRLRPLPPPTLPAARAVIFTSENAVHAYRQLAGAAEGRTAWCVGGRTAAAARAAGFAAQSADGDAGALAALLIARQAEGPVLHLRGVHSRGSLAAELNSAGIETLEAVIYDQQPCPLTAEAEALLAGQSPLLAPLFSPRTAELFATAAAATPATAPLHVIAMSRAVAGALGAFAPATLDIAARPDAEAVIAALAQRIAASGLA